MRRILVLLAAAAMAAVHAVAIPATWLSVASPVAPGIDFFTSTDPSLVDPPGPTAVFLLRIDPATARLDSVHANDELLGVEPVAALAARHHALAAINGGFFDVHNGDPIGVMKEAGELVSDSAAIKGAVVIRSPPRGRTDVLFDQMSARVDLTFTTSGHVSTVAIDGVDETRERGKLMLYTPSYHPDSDTAPGGTEWIIGGRPEHVIDERHGAGHTPIPRDGDVLSYGGLDVPAALAALVPGVRVALHTRWRTLNGLAPSRLDAADAIVDGAGLLRVGGRVLSGWETTEGLNVQTFITARHPRTLIGVDRRGAIWLGVVDGRQPAHSVGMQFSDLERLCDRLDLVSALNLDGGGSTTMVVRDRVVNMPSDAAGPRPVGDAILVSRR